MNASKTVTSIFIFVALAALVALAISVNRKSATDSEIESQLDFPILPGLAENLRSLERISDFPARNIRSVKVIRTNGDEVGVIRERPGSAEFQFEVPPPDSISAFSAILFANAAFLDGLRSRNAFAVTGDTAESVIGQLTYTSFDGLVLKSIVFRAQDATWLRIVASYAPKLEARYEATADEDLLSADEVIEIARKLNGRVYKKPDE